MASINIFSAGAAQSVVAGLSPDFQAKHGCVIHTTYGGVQTLKARLLAGEHADVIVLTDALIDELEVAALILTGSRQNLGSVGTGIAVRAGTACPDVSSLTALRATLLRCSRIICPDPAATTAGGVLMAVLRRLDIDAHLRSRLDFHPSGHHAMAELAAGAREGEIGVVQMTEIMANASVALAGPLPQAVQHLAVYAVGQAKQSTSPALARAFIHQLIGQRAILQAAGFSQGQTLAPQTTVQE